MEKSFYSPGEQRAARVNDLFAAVAARYDLINDVQSFGLHRLWKRKVVRMAQVHPGDRALDVCCGTGDISLALARRGAQVTGLDFSRPMLNVAGERSRKLKSRETRSETADPAKFRNPAFVCGDAQHLPFPDDSFEIVTVGYGLRNLARWDAGLAEMQRVAKPGGRVLVLDFGKPKHSLWRRLYFCHLRVFVPALGRILCRNTAAYAYILESLKDYPAQEGVAAQMRALGFENVRLINFLGGVMSIHCGAKAGGSEFLPS